MTAERAERSRRAILDAALQLFSTQGFRSTSTRDIAEAAGTSTGALYHHFSDKELIFQTLLDEFWEVTGAPDFPLMKAMYSGAFPEDLKMLAYAARQTVQQYRPYIRLIYVDVIEFEGMHIRRLYESITSRFATFLQERPEVRSKLRDDVSPLTSAILVARVLVYLYSIEHVFGVPNQFGGDEDAVLDDIVNILRRGIVA